MCVSVCVCVCLCVSVCEFSIKVHLGCVGLERGASEADFDPKKPWVPVGPPPGATP